MNYLKQNVQSEKHLKDKVIDHVSALCLWGFMALLELTTRETVSPLVSMFCMGLIAYRMPPRAVAFWSLVFSGTCLYFLLQPGPDHITVDRATAFIRFWTVVAGGAGAVALSFDRTRIAEGFHQTVEILEKLPTPVIISDGEGRVVFMNNDALEFLGTTLNEARGASYFSFITGTEKGRTVQKYLDFVDSKKAVLKDMPLQIKKPKPREIRATLVAVEGERAKLVATVFSTVGDMPVATGANPPTV